MNVLKTSIAQTRRNPLVLSGLFGKGDSVGVQHHLFGGNPDAEDGVWRTLESGTHVFIRGGKITKGPHGLEGKTIAEAKETPRQGTKEFHAKSAAEHHDAADRLMIQHKRSGFSSKELANKINEHHDKAIEHEIALRDIERSAPIPSPSVQSAVADAKAKVAMPTMKAKPIIDAAIAKQAEGQNESESPHENEAWKSSDLRSSPNISESSVTARKGADGKYRLHYIGTTVEVFPGQRFKSAHEARHFFKVQKIKAQRGLALSASEPHPCPTCTSTDTTHKPMSGGRYFHRCKACGKVWVKGGKDEMVESH